MKIVLSSGHGKQVRGAAGVLDEVDEARRVVNQLAIDLRKLSVEVETYHDDVSTTQDENLNRIVDFHNSKVRDLDVSVHFNAFEPTAEPRGTEVLYLTQAQLATDLAATIADAGLVDRGAKYRDDLFFLNQTAEKAVLSEVCFVDSEADAEVYYNQFDWICNSLAMMLALWDPEDEPAEAA